MTNEMKMKIEAWGNANNNLSDLKDALAKIMKDNENYAISCLVHEIEVEAGEEAKARRALGVKTWEEAMRLYLDATA